MDMYIIRRGLFIVIILGISVKSHAQDATFDAQGFQQNHAYESRFDFEYIDPFIGNVILTFTDLMFPGNAGLDVRWEHVHNSKVLGGWSFGLRGVPMFIDHAEAQVSPDPLLEPPLPRYYTSDGATHSTGYAMPPDYDGTNVVVSQEFWRFDRRTRVLSMPNGWKAQYNVIDTREATTQNPWGQDVRYLTRIEDPFGNAIDLTYDTSGKPTLTSITQQLQNGQSRLITLGYTGALLTTVHFGSRTWSYVYQAIGPEYVLSDVVPPVGPGWHYDYDTAGHLTKVITPNGGEISYQYLPHEFPALQNPPGTPGVNSLVVTQRTVGGRSVQHPGTWTYEYVTTSDGETTTIREP